MVLIRFLFLILLFAEMAIASQEVSTYSGFPDTLLDIETSSRYRAIASLQATTTSRNFRVNRSNYPETDPMICLAFLSCCNRTDLLNHTIAGAIRHMEEDEPSYLRYEIAWVDNGNAKLSTEYIKDSYPIEHALTLSENMGLAFGMNLLVHNLCKAPYILFLEEDWLYLDGLVAYQTEERKRSIATSISLLQNLQTNNVTAFDGRSVIGVFLRNESYESFLTFPHADVWERRKEVSIRSALSTLSDSCSNNAEITNQKNEEDGNCNDDDIVSIDYRIFCADTGIKGGGSVWGSYTNGAGLYRRANLINVGRQFGEPGDAFHDRYVESNFAYRVALSNCHAALRLTKDESCSSIHDTECTGAFHHIGGGRGTRPRTAKDTKCMDEGWNFFGTPLYEKYQKFVEQSTGEPSQKCSRDELQELRDQQFRNVDTESYREEVRSENEAIFLREAQERQKLRDQAMLVRTMLQKDEGISLRQMVPWMRDLSDKEIAEKANHMEDLADSPHPLNGFWDMHGRVKKDRN